MKPEQAKVLATLILEPIENVALAYCEEQLAYGDIPTPEDLLDIEHEGVSLEQVLAYFRSDYLGAEVDKGLEQIIEEAKNNVRDARTYAEEVRRTYAREVGFGH